MKAKAIRLLTGLCAVMAFGFVQAEGEPPAPTNTWPIFAGQHTLVGEVTVFNQITGEGGEGSTVIEYRITEPGWCFEEVHLYVNDTAPSHHSPGKFTYGEEFDDCRATVSFASDSIITTEIYIAAHAVVSNTVTGANETGWAAGEFSFKKSWGSYFKTTPGGGNGNG